MENTLNRIYMQVRGKVGLSQELEMDKDYSVTVTCVEKADKSNADGSVDRTFKCQLFATDSSGENANDWKEQGGKSLSLQQRSALFVFWEQETKSGHIAVDFDKYYEIYMTKKIDEIKEKLI